MIPLIHFADTTTVIPAPAYVQIQQTDYTKKCLESDELADLHAKQLQNEQFTEEDAAKITECIAKKKENEAEAIGWAVISVGVFLVALIIGSCII